MSESSPPPDRAPASREQRAPASTPDDPPPEPPRGPPPAAYVADLMLVAVCAWFLWSDFDAARTGEVKVQARSWTFMLNLTCAFVLVHRAMALFQRRFAGQRSRRLLGGLTWGLAIVVPVAVAVHLEQEVKVAHEAKLDQYVARVAQLIDAARAGGLAIAPADLESLTSPYLSRLTVRTDSGAFLVQVFLPAFDIDGYTGLYSSTEGRWHIHHNDIPPDSTPSFDAAGPILVCTPEGARLACR